jgi:N-acylglucosamine 2-epimerase
MKPDLKLVMETVGTDASILDNFDGRTLTPGHSIEAAWFILDEARRRGGSPALVNIGTTILDWMWEAGYDKDFGGILYFIDIYGLPVQEYWHDMKFWWPQCETIIATIMAYEATGEQKYFNWFKEIHDYAFSNFPDKEYGEWYGYLHRDGRISVSLKGNLWKGPFHIPRMYLRVWQTLESINKKL